jgi:hypothetical protein
MPSGLHTYLCSACTYTTSNHCALSCWVKSKPARTAGAWREPQAASFVTQMLQTKSHPHAGFCAP